MLPKAAGLFEKLPRTLRRHRLMKAWMRLTGEDALQLVRIRGDAFGYADLSDGFLRLIVIDGEYDKDFFRVADALLREGGEFLDVGANHGLLSFGLAKKLQDRVRFHLFEPNPKLLESIGRSLELYPSMVTEINPVAVCEEDSTILFHVQEDQTGASHIVKNGGVPIRSIKLDTYLKDKCLNHVELLKLDIEGYELAALRGAEHALKNRTVKAVYFEYFEKCLVRVAPPQVLLDYLESVGFAVCFCRYCDFETRGTPALTLKQGLPGHGPAALGGQGIPTSGDD
jgi:FkbM family methyltransferase